MPAFRNLCSVAGCFSAMESKIPNFTPSLTLCSGVVRCPLNDDLGSKIGKTAETLQITFPMPSYSCYTQALLLLWIQTLLTFLFPPVIWGLSLPGCYPFLGSLLLPLSTIPCKLSKRLVLSVALCPIATI